MYIYGVVFSRGNRTVKSLLLPSCGELPRDTGSWWDVSLEMWEGREEEGIENSHQEKAPLGKYSIWPVHTV